MPIPTAAGQLHPNGIDVSVDDSVGGFHWKPVSSESVASPTQATYAIPRTAADPAVSTLNAAQLLALVKLTHPSATELRDGDNLDVVIDGETEQKFKISSGVVANPITQSGGGAVAVGGLIVTPFADTYGALPQTRVGGSPRVIGDVTRLTADNGGNLAGWYRFDGSLWAWFSDGASDDFSTVADMATFTSELGTKADGHQWFIQTNHLTFRQGTPLTDFQSRATDDANMATFTELQNGQCVFNAAEVITYLWNGTFFHEKHSSPPASAATAAAQTVTVGSVDWISRELESSGIFVWDVAAIVASSDDFIQVADNAALAADNSANNRQDGFVWNVLTSRVLYMRGEGGAVAIETLVTSNSDADMFTITEQVANQRCYRSDLNVVYMWRPQGFWAMEHMDPPTSAATATNQTVVIGTTRWMSRLLGGSQFAWDLEDHDVEKNDERTLSSPSSHGLTAADITDVAKNGWILDKDGMPVPGNASASGKFTPAFDIIEIVNTTQYVARARGTFLDKSYTWDLTNGGAVVDGVPIENSRWMLLQADGTMDHAADPNVSLVNGYFINANLIIIPGRQPTFTATTEIPTFAAFDVTLGGPYTMLRSDKTIVYTDGGVGAGVINLIDAEFFSRHWFDGRAITNKSGDTLTLAPKPGETVNGLASANVPDGVTWHMELDPLDPTNIVARV